MKKQGHWQEICQFSNTKKAWREDIKTGNKYIIDENGNCLKFLIGNDLPIKARKEEIVGYLDWKAI